MYSCTLAYLPRYFMGGGGVCGMSMNVRTEETCDCEFYYIASVCKHTVCSH